MSRVHGASSTRPFSTRAGSRAIARRVDARPARSLACGYRTRLPNAATEGGAADGSAEESIDAAFEAEPIPSQDVADAAAEAEITEENADEEYEALKKEIDGND